MGQGCRGQFSCYPGRVHNPSPGLQVMEKEWTRAEMPSVSAMADASPASSEASTSGSVGYIAHTVTRLDTLAGVAIKYGVEVCLFELNLKNFVVSLLQSVSVQGSVVLVEFVVLFVRSLTLLRLCLSLGRGPTNYMSNMAVCVVSSMRAIAK